MTELNFPNSLFLLPTGGNEAVVITTNGAIRKNGNAVMGKGIALEAKERFPDLEYNLGEYIRCFGN